MRLQNVVAHLVPDLQWQILRGHDRVDKIKFVEELIGVSFEFLRENRELSKDNGIDNSGDNDEHYHESELVFSARRNIDH